MHDHESFDEWALDEDEIESEGIDMIISEAEFDRMTDKIESLKKEVQKLREALHKYKKKDG